MKKLLFLTLLPVFGLLLSNNSFATQHDYEGLYTGDIFHPDILYDSSSQSYYFDFSQSNPYLINNSWASPTTNNLLWVFDSNYDMLNTRPYDSVGYHLNLYQNDSLINLNNGVCEVPPTSSNNYYISRNLYLNTVNSKKYVYYNTVASTFSSWSSVSPCYSFNYNYSYHYEHIIDHNEWKYREWNSSPSYPYAPEGFSGLSSKGTDGLRLSDSAVNSGGITYSGSFSPSRLVENNNMAGFSSLYIPLFTSDGYFMDSSKLYYGRQLEWHFVFNFKDNMVIRSDSTIKLKSNMNWLKYRPDQYTSNTSFSANCSSDAIHSNIEGQDFTTLNIVCPVVLDNDYLNFFPTLSLEAGGDYSFFEQWGSNDWYFSSAFLVTDNDYTPGSSFNDDIKGGDWSIFNGTQYEDASDPDWVLSLQNLFSFGLPISSTPMGLILGGFTSQDNCASIPTIAGMLSTTNTTVCPFFPASVRSVVTPVLGLFSVCLVFGAFMSWLGGSSGNFIEDSSTHSFGGFKIAKGGKK